jgi:3-oxoacyl-[acyl-carrier-protein] synthase-1/3-oxoacyl-[acyl-carrier-protein] synthase II
MALGEGAAIVALVRGDDTRGARVHARFAGFGASNDATHLTAPDRTGGGLARAASAALGDAGCEASTIDLVSAHGTATPFNDAMESRAIAAALHGSEPVVHAFKAQIGHTLGAAGALEALAAAHALATGVAPASAGSDDRAPLDPDASVSLLDCNELRHPRAALKLSAAFGGSNAALALTRPTDVSVRRSKKRRDAKLAGWARVSTADAAELATALGIPRDRLGRVDALCRLGLAAVAALARDISRERLAGAGIVAGQALATIETNDAYAARLRARGAAAAEPRVFPATSPNALVGECAIAFGLTGPSFAVGAGLDAGIEALAAAAELVSAGDADRVVVVAADDAGPAARDLVRCAGWEGRALAAGAVALLVAADGGGRAVDPGLRAAHEGDGPIGHLTLLRWLAA